MRIITLIISGVTGLMVLCSSCPCPFDRETGADAASIWTSNGKVSSVTANICVVNTDCNKPGYVPKQDNSGAGAIVRIWADKKIVWKSDIIKEAEEPISVDVNLNGAKEIVLESVFPGPWYQLPKTRVKWSAITFKGEKGASIKPFKDKKAFAQLGILTPAEKPEPRFNGADIWGVRPGHPVIFRVPVSGERPMKFTASGLPEGVTFDTEKGILGGIAPSKAGAYDIVVTAENAKGKAERTIRLQVGEVIALTPPMGWNSWNIFTHLLTARHAKDAALALENSGLANYGWAYINLDDYWERNNSGNPRSKEREELYGLGNITGPVRDEQGRILTNKSFPDMKELTDYIHSFGFKAGIYSSPGPLTCGNCEGSYGHELEDATSWAEWGFDYIKYDWCKYTRIFEMVNGVNPWSVHLISNAFETGKIQEYIHPYALMNGCLKKQNRDILYSYCQYGMAEVHKWGRENGANCWRSWGDLKDSWNWMLQAIDSRIDGEYWKYCGPGFWADPDMMIIGDQRSYGSVHPTFLTPNEQYTHVSIWAMVGSPLLIGCDMTKLDDFTLSLLTNPEVIAISQDRLGKVARRYVKTDSENVWARPLANGDWAIALENLYPAAKEIKFDLSNLGLEGIFRVMDCWSGQDEGMTSDRVSYRVGAHATKLIRLKRVDCPKCEMNSVSSRSEKNK